MGKEQKMRTVRIKVSEAEPNALDDILLVWNLCKKHNAMINATERQYAIAQATCPDCQKEHKKIFKKAWAVESKLWKAYDK